MNKKILFVNPRSKNSPLVLVPPLVLGVLASYVRKVFPDAEINLVDEIASDYLTVRDLRRFAPDLVAVTCMTEFSYRAYEIADLARECGIKSVVGGKHPTIYPEEAAKHFDYVVVGDGEIALSKIISGKVDKKIISGEYIEDLDEIPPMPWELLNTKKYLTVHHRSEFLKTHTPFNRVAYIHTDRGCPNSCIYCYNSLNDYKKIRYHSPARVIYEWRYLIDNYQPDLISFADDNLMMNKRRLTEICRLIKEDNSGVPWDCSASTNAILANRDILPVMKEAGCRIISIGLESQSGRILKMIKGSVFSPESNIQAVRACRDNGIKVRGFFMIGIPTETEEELSETVEYVMKKEVDYLSLQAVKPYPGTLLWNTCQEMGLIPDGFRWDQFFMYSFHEKFSYQFLTKVLIDCNHAYIPYTPKRLFKEAMLRPKDAIRKMFGEKDAMAIVRKMFKK